MTGLVIQIGPELAPHLARALDGHLIWLRAQGFPVPDGLVEARDWARVVTAGLSSPSSLPESHDAVMPSLLSLPQVAEELGCSTSKVKALIEKGELKAVQFEGVRRVRRVDLEAYLEGLAGGRSFRDDVQVKDPAAIVPPAPEPSASDRREHGGTDRERVA